VSLAVVIPTLNEAENVAGVVRAVLQVLPGATVFVVDDESSDGTATLARDAGARVIARRGPRGLGHAYREGFARVLAEGFGAVYQMDADGSHDPPVLPTLVGGDLVIGSRWVKGGGTRGWSLGRQVLSRFGSAYARAWLDLPLRDLTGGFKRWDADLLRRVLPNCTQSGGYAFQVETTLRAHEAGARIVEVPITFAERARGRSKMSPAIALEAARVVPGLRR